MSNAVIDQVISIIPDMVNVDSDLFIDWIWANRQKQGLSTRKEKYVVLPDVSVGLDKTVESFKDMFRSYFSSEDLFRGLLPEEDGSCVKLYLIASEQKPSGEIHITATGDEALVRKAMATLKAGYSRPRVVSIETLIGYSGIEANVEKTELVESEQSFAKQEFYPWLDQSIEEFAEAFSRSRSNVTLLVGPPGTGKSTFLRTMMLLLDRERKGLVDHEPLILDYNFGRWMRSFRRDGVLGIEDADRLVLSRQSGNDQMSMVLNTADGVVSGNGKFIISTNLPSISKVDPALLRPGRNFAVLEFGLLTAEQAAAARASVGMKPIEFDPDRKYALGEALSEHPSVFHPSDHSRTGTGFI